MKSRALAMKSRYQRPLRLGTRRCVEKSTYASPKRFA